MFRSTTHLFLSSILVLVVWSSAKAAIPEAAISLEKAYQAALNLSEDIANQAELVNQAELRYSQAKGALFPTINASALYLKQDAPPAGTATNLSPSDQETVKVTATQPLFRGFREWATLKQTKIASESTSLARDNALRQMYSDLALAYYQVLAAEQDYKNLLGEIDVNQKRLDELKNFRKLGRTRESEVLMQEANIATLDAQIEAAKFTIENSRAALSILTGMSRNADLKDSEVFPSAVNSLEYYVDKIEKRPDIQAAQKAVESAEQGIRVARGGHLPSLDLLGNYYFLRPDGFLKNVKWDVQLALTFPIFQGGIVNSQIDIAASQLKQSELTLAKTKRVAKDTVETLYAQVKNDLVQVQKQKRAADLNEQNYQAERKDYRNGLVTNIDVLASLNNAQEAKRNLDKAQYQFKINYMQLLAATNERPVNTQAAPEAKKD